MERRSFLEFIGKGIVAYGVVPLVFSGCKEVKTIADFKLPFKGIKPISTDSLELAEGFLSELLISWGEDIGNKETFGFNNDYTAFIPLKKGDNSEGYLWVNHEYPHPLFVSGFTGGERTKEQVDKELYSVGGSILRIKQDENGKWSLAKSSENKRITGHTEIPFNWPHEIRGTKSGIGTLANCSGGVTPWGTILTCEENYDMFYGERVYPEDAPEGTMVSGYYGWEAFLDYPTEHYGWVVEVDPRTGKAQKHIALGRCAHECATMQPLPDGRLVVYTGDDANDRCTYKFVGSKPNSLTEGTLYVANFETGKWVSLDWETHPILKEKFKDQTEVLIRLREAAPLVGGSPCNRPEDIEIDPITGDVLIAMTNNKPKGDFLGSIVRIQEKDGKYDALEFQSDTYLAGDIETGWACPDNMAFDPSGNLWFTSDISGSEIGLGAYEALGNNGLYLVPRHGKDAGKVIQVASAPMDAEITGPFFTDDGKNLFLSIQHPGETSPNLNDLTSHWPNGGTSMPKPSVVVISGPSLEAITQISIIKD